MLGAEVRHLPMELHAHISLPSLHLQCARLRQERRAAAWAGAHRKRCACCALHARPASCVRARAVVRPQRRRRRWMGCLARLQAATCSMQHADAAWRESIEPSSKSNARMHALRMAQLDRAHDTTGQALSDADLAGRRRQPSQLPREQAGGAAVVWRVQLAAAAASSAGAARSLTRRPEAPSEANCNQHTLLRFTSPCLHARAPEGDDRPEIYSAAPRPACCGAAGCSALWGEREERGRGAARAAGKPHDEALGSSCQGIRHSDSVTATRRASRLLLPAAHRHGPTQRCCLAFTFSLCKRRHSGRGATATCRRASSRMLRTIGAQEQADLRRSLHSVHLRACSHALTCRASCAPLAPCLMLLHAVLIPLKARQLHATSSRSAGCGHIRHASAAACRLDWQQLQRNISSCQSLRRSGAAACCSARYARRRLLSQLGRMCLRAWPWRR
jgi:hypothetical protein